MTIKKTKDDKHDEALETLYRDRRRAHAVLFAHRHTSSTALFQLEMIDLLHGPERLACIVAFRDSAKSTYAEEALCLMSSFRELKHGLVVGASLQKAQERLHSIRRQFERNEDLREMFGPLVGHPWGDDDIELASGVRIQAMGRNQAIRGTKAEDFRPDFILCDDIEDRQSLATVEGREKVQNWFFDELLPSGDRKRLRVRVLANDMHVECLANVLEKPDSGFVVKRYPCMFRNDKGADESTWPEGFPLEEIRKLRERMYAVGRGDEFEQNYMCRSTTPAQRLFRRSMVRVEPRVRTWEAVYGAYDPARTLGKNAADTGHARWSWINNRLVVWEAWGRQLLPDEIVRAIYDDDGDRESGRYTRIGVDEVGLSQFLMQPIRQEGLRRGITLPITPLKLKDNKTQRIRALQPWFIAHEVHFTKPFPDLESQLVNFPTGKVDILDCLACAILMRPGLPVFEDWTPGHVMDNAEAGDGTVWLALNAKPSLLTAVLVQYRGGRLTVLLDWVREGDPPALVADILQEARLEIASYPRLVAPPRQFDKYTNLGLPQAARRLAVDIRKGSGEADGRAELRTLMRRNLRGLPALLVSSRARWVVNGFAGGYARGADKRTGQLTDVSEDNEYRVLMEGLESFAGLLRFQAETLSSSGEDDAKNYTESAEGRRYISSLPVRQRSRE